jgi:hypothetical protein
MKLLVLALGVAIAGGSVIASAGQADYSKALVGSWIYSGKARPTRIVVFHPDGSWGVRKFDDQPEDIRGRRWRVDGDSLILRYPSDYGFETGAYKILSFAPRKFVTETQGYRFTYTRIE